MGFRRFFTDHGVYVVGEGDERVFISLYVDDLLMMWKERERLEEVKRVLAANFKLRDLGSSTFLLGIGITRPEEGGIFLGQSKYSQDIVAKYGMEGGKGVSAPFEAGSELGEKDSPATEEGKKEM